MRLDDDQEPDTLDLDTDDQDEEQDQGAAQDDAEEEDGEEEQLFFDGEEPAAGNDSELVKHLRDKITTLQRDRAAERKAPVTESPIVVGEKPTIESCEWDADKFEMERDAYDDRVRAKQEQDNRLNRAREESDREWQDVTRAYAEKRRALPFRDVEAVEAVAFSELSDTQQAVIARIADNPAKLIYALGKSPVKLAAVSKITNPLLLTKEITKLEATLTTTKGKRPPDPQPVLRGKTITTNRDKKLEEMEKRIGPNGDRSEIIAYKASLKKA